MKKILILILLFPALAQAQEHDTIPQEWAQGVTLRGMTSLYTHQFRVPDCEAWETFTGWQAKNTGKTKCAHDWAVAEWDEVNTRNLYTTLEMPPPCGKTRYDNEARICRTCLRHETRVRTYGMKEVERKSEFQSLLEKINDR